MEYADHMARQARIRVAAFHFHRTAENREAQDLAQAWQEAADEFSAVTLDIDRFKLQLAQLGTSARDERRRKGLTPEVERLEKRAASLQAAIVKIEARFPRSDEVLVAAGLKEKEK